jgi:hypothetical protein
MIDPKCRNCGAQLTVKSRGRRPSWCSDNCRKQFARTTRPAVVAGLTPGRAVLELVDGDPGPTATVVAELVAELDFGSGDVRRGLALLATQMAAAVDARPGDVSVTRELRQLLTVLAQTDQASTALTGHVDDQRIRWLTQRALAAASGESGAS